MYFRNSYRRIESFLWSRWSCFCFRASKRSHTGTSPPIRQRIACVCCPCPPENRNRLAATSRFGRCRRIGRRWCGFLAGTPRIRHPDYPSAVAFRRSISWRRLGHYRRRKSGYPNKLRESGIRRHRGSARRTRSGNRLDGQLRGTFRTGKLRSYFFHPFRACLAGRSDGCALCVAANETYCPFSPSFMEKLSGESLNPISASALFYVSLHSQFNFDLFLRPI